MRSPRWIILASLLSVVAGCGDAADDDADVLVVATTGMLGDLAANVAGDEAEVVVLIPTGVDPHDFQPSSRQVASLQRADLVVANGLDLEEGLSDVLAATAEDGVEVLEIAPAVDPLPFATGGDLDPHVWMDPQRMITAAGLVAGRLAVSVPDGGWEERAEVYGRQLAELDAEIEATLAVVAPPRRLLVTNHDALGYFAARYGFEVVGVVIPGGSTLADPSSAELAELVDVIIARDVPAIFAETTEPGALAEAVAAEVGGDVAVVELYTGSLGEPGSGADTLAGMLRTDAGLISEALAG